MKVFNEVSDTITGICFSEDGSVIAVTSWDCNVYFYKSSDHSFLDKRSLSSPILCLTFCNGSFFVGCAGENSGSIYSVMPYHDPSLFGSHKASVSGLGASSMGLVSCSWDSSANLWDMNSKSVLETWSLPERAYTMSVNSNIIAVGCASRYVVVIDILKNKLYKYESALRHQTSQVHITSLNRMVTASVEGRMAVMMVPEPATEPLLCKGHLRSYFEKTVAYSINAIDSCQNTLFTGGSDGMVNVFDLTKPSIISSFFGEEPISFLKFNKNSLYVSTGYNWENGPKEPQKPITYIIPIDKAN